MWFVAYLKKKAPDWGDIEFVKNKTTKKSFRLRDKVGSIWSSMGSRLGIEPDILDCIIDEEHSNERRLYRVMKRWFDNAGQLPNSDEYPRTWEGLRNLLDNCEQQETAKEYFEFLSKC
jgi:hypothetical protein